MKREKDTKHLNIRPVLTRAGIFTGDREFTISAHQHFDFELIYTTKGIYECELNEQKHRLKPGEGLLNCPGDWHTDIYHKGLSYLAVNFVLHGHESDKAFFPHASTPENQLIFTDRDNVIKNLLERIIAENSKLDQFSSTIQEAILMELFWQIIRFLPNNMVSEDIFEDVGKTKFQHNLELIFQQHINGSLDLPQMASMLYVTPRTLSNHCQQFLRISPVKAFMKFKMDYAMELVSKTDMSIKEISEYLGFANPYHFSKVFKKTFFTSPSKLRDKK